MALKIFSLPKVTSSDVGGADSAVFNFQDILLNIFLKFIDVIEGVGIILVGIFVMRLIKAYLERIQVQHERQRTALNLLEKITSGFIIVISLTLGLKVMGLDLTLIVSVILLGVSFGLRDVIKNYVAGLQILLKSPFEIGDVVQIRSYVGRIERIEFQATTMRTFDNKTITIQNRDLLVQTLTNFSKAAQTRLEIILPVSAGADMHRALKAFEKVLGGNPAVLKSPAYSVVFKTFVAKNANILVRFWVQKPCNELKIRSDLAFELQRTLAKIGEKDGEGESAAVNGVPSTNGAGTAAAANGAESANGGGAASANGASVGWQPVELVPVLVTEYADIDEPA